MAKLGQLSNTESVRELIGEPRCSRHELRSRICYFIKVNSSFGGRWRFRDKIPKWSHERAALA
jgi:hypothetical protein